MDARRNRTHLGSESTKLSSSNSTLPGLVTIAIGIILLILCICLFAAFGFPTEMAEKPKQISGVVALVLGVILTIVGVAISVYLKRKKEAKDKELARLKKARVSPDVTPPPYDRGPPPDYKDVPRQPRNYNDRDYLSTVSS